MTGDELRAIIPSLTALCQKAGAVILSYYGKREALAIRAKDNHTPLTAADLAAHGILHDGLVAIANLPVVSEEAEASHRRQTGRYWLIDPIDGTREFIRESGEFCILIALIDAHRPVLAMIYAPVSGDIWYAVRGAGSYKTDASGRTQRLQCRTPPAPPAVITHNFAQSKRMQQYLAESFGAEHPHLRMGSALKFCAIAEGRADFYPKIVAKTSEWDIAAGDLLLHEAGGGIRFADGRLPQYGLSAHTTNPPFLAFSRLDASARAHYLQILARWMIEEPRHGDMPPP
ncbi:MAG: 3'(2'),5'-bisphosphate nucleotidase CysQ [Cardiobacteriaceae bacterium]|nr:3'(2'),5'-bisphosphate nucleotidase CysQ [Cardiobacteriaceae bacterium]